MCLVDILVACLCSWLGLIVKTLATERLARFELILSMSACSAPARTSIAESAVRACVYRISCRRACVYGRVSWRTHVPGRRLGAYSVNVCVHCLRASLFACLCCVRARCARHIRSTASASPVRVLPLCAYWRCECSSTGNRCCVLVFITEFAVRACVYRLFW